MRNQPDRRILVKLARDNLTLQPAATTISNLQKAPGNTRQQQHHASVRARLSVLNSITLLLFLFGIPESFKLWSRCLSVFSLISRLFLRSITPFGKEGVLSPASRLPARNGGSKDGYGRKDERSEATAASGESERERRPFFAPLAPD